MKIKQTFIVLIISFLISQQTFSQQNVLMTDINGFTFYPIFSKAKGAPSALYYFDIQYERSISDARSIFFSIGHGKMGVSETFRNDEPYFKIETKATMLSFEYRDYYSERKGSPLGFYTGYFYKHYFVKEKYYDFEEEGYILSESDKGNIYSIGGRLGYKFGDRIIIDPSFTVSMAYTAGLEIHDDPYDEMKWLRRFSFPISFNLSVGYKF